MGELGVGSAGGEGSGGDGKLASSVLGLTGMAVCRSAKASPSDTPETSDVTRVGLPSPPLTPDTSDVMRL